jgi:hypothetical protein
MIVKRQLQRISRVPRVSGEETKFVVVFGVVQEVSKTVYAFAVAAKPRTKWIVNIRMV